MPNKKSDGLRNAIDYAALPRAVRIITDALLNPDARAKAKLDELDRKLDELENGPLLEEAPD